ncbi:hypothetical protein TWF481_002947 [Arthrobotrys musiformis]|uniref:Uncharacterized protein n=1 Tax=Arthrobotrys musiformis TaxID=47236 RepID=A0AAV9VT03_9PEZI
MAVTVISYWTDGSGRYSRDSPSITARFKRQCGPKWNSQQRVNGEATSEQATPPDPGEIEPTAPQVRTQDPATPVSHTTPAASEAEETSHPQILFEIQDAPHLRTLSINRCVMLSGPCLMKQCGN